VEDVSLEVSEFLTVRGLGGGIEVLAPKVFGPSIPPLHPLPSFSWCLTEM
jgi:hypothetical protein